MPMFMTTIQQSMQRMKKVCGEGTGNSKLGQYDIIQADH